MEKTFERLFGFSVPLRVLIALSGALGEVICVRAKPPFQTNIKWPDSESALRGRRAGSQTDGEMKALSQSHVLLGIKTEPLVEWQLCGGEKDTKAKCRREWSGNAVITRACVFFVFFLQAANNYSSSFQPSDFLITWQGLEAGVKPSAGSLFPLARCADSWSRDL